MLDQMTNRLRARHDLRSLVDTILADVIALHGAEFGSIQLVANNVLLLVAERGLGSDFAKAFPRVTDADVSACARAFRKRGPVVIPDISKDLLFKPYVCAALKIGFQAVQSTPLISSDGKMISVISTQFATPHQPTPIEMDTCVKYCGIAADYIKTIIGDRDTAAEARRLQQELLQSTPSARDRAEIRSGAVS
jgi:GAF domain-containing protein